MDVEDDPHVTRSSKGKRKTREEDQGKGSAKRKKKKEDYDSWYEEEDKIEDNMETDSEEVQILSSQKQKGKIMRSEYLGAKNHSPFPTHSKDYNKIFAGEDTSIKEAKIVESKEVGLEVNLDTVGDKA